MNAFDQALARAFDQQHENLKNLEVQQQQDGDTPNMMEPTPERQHLDTYGEEAKQKSAAPDPPRAGEFPKFSELSEIVGQRSETYGPEEEQESWYPAQAMDDARSDPTFEEPGADYDKENHADNNHSPFMETIDIPSYLENEEAADFLAESEQSFETSEAEAAESRYPNEAMDDASSGPMYEEPGADYDEEKLGDDNYYPSMENIDIPSYLESPESEEADEFPAAAFSDDTMSVYEPTSDIPRGNISTGCTTLRSGLQEIFNRRPTVEVPSGIEKIVYILCTTKSKNPNQYADLLHRSPRFFVSPRTTDCARLVPRCCCHVLSSLLILHVHNILIFVL